MGRDAIEPKIYDLLATARPGEWAVRLWVPQDLLDEETVIPEGCALKDLPQCEQRDDALYKGYGDYRLTACEDVGEGYMGFIFGKPREATLEGALVRRVPDKMMMVWPPVLRCFYAMEGLVDDWQETGDFGGSRTTNFVKKRRVLERVDFVPAAELPTEVVRETYQAPVPFAAELLDARKWVTSRVAIRFQDIQFSADCLHDTVTVPELMVEGELVRGLGTPNAADRNRANGQIFPATNYKTWPAEIVIESRQVFTGRLYELTRVVAKAPKMPPPQQVPMR